MYRLYDIINDLCKTKGITPGKMCRDIGISRGLITDLKMGRKSTANGLTLIKIADYLNVSVDFLLAGQRNTVDFEYIGTMINILINNPDARILIEKISTMPSDDIKKVLSMIEILDSQNS